MKVLLVMAAAAEVLAVGCGGATQSPFYVNFSRR